MSTSVFEHPILSGLLGDAQIAEWFSTEREIDAMLRFESALAVVQEQAGVLPAGTAACIKQACRQFTPDMEALRAATLRDGVCVPELVRQLRAAVGEPFLSHVHFAATSQDVIDTALVLRLKPILEDFALRLVTLNEQLDEAKDRFGTNRLMGHTRMQQALPIRVADKLDTWRQPLVDLLASLGSLKTRVLRLQYGGAVGTLDKLGDKKAEISARLALELGLANQGCWHTNRGPLVECANWLSQVSGALGKMGQDVALMAQNEVGEIKLSGSGGSSAMPHKQNPVSAEVLVTLARFNSTLLSGMHASLVHENERSGSAWTLEWMLLPQMVMASAAGLRSASVLLGNLEQIGTAEDSNAQ